MSEAQELVEFLAPGDNPALTSQALEIVEGLSGTAEGLASLRPVAPTLYKNLLACAKRVQLSRSALTAVVNATQDAPIANVFIEAGACTRLADYLREGTCGHPDLIIMALSNLTQTDKGAAKLLQVGQGDLEGAHMRRFLATALQPGASDSIYQHATGVVCNCTRVPEGRALLTEPGSGGVAALAEALSSKAAVKRVGAAAALKNLAVAAHQDGTVESFVSDADALRKMLVPVNGQPPKELEDSVREDVATAIAAVCRADAGRTAFMDVGAADALKAGYEYEEHPATCQAMEAAARLFLGVQEDEDADAQEGVVMMG